MSQTSHHAPTQRVLLGIAYRVMAMACMAAIVTLSGIYILHRELRRFRTAPEN